MKLFRILALFVMTVNTTFAQEAVFNIKYSEPLAVFVYVEHLSSKRSDNVFKTQFLNSIYNREKYKELLILFDSLRINYSYEFEGYPYGSKIPGMTENILKKCLLSSSNLKDFKKLSAGLIPNATLLQLSAVLYEFQLVYRELVYHPQKVKFEKHLREISDLAKSKNISSFFNKSLVFYKSYWDETLPFEIAFYPIPGTEGFSAEAFCNNAVSALPTGGRDYISVLSVMMHEIFHIVYNEQPLYVKRNIARWFAANNSKSSAYAYLLLNEVLATAMGNGYVYESLRGKQDVEDWYNRKYINVLAKKIYPMLADYIAQKKAIDQGFINIYIKFYEDNFTDWLQEMDNLMCYRYVITDNAADFEVLSNLYPYTSLFQYEDTITESSVDRMKSCPVTKVIIVSKDNEAKLAMLKSKFPELDNWKYKAKQDFFYHTFLQDKTQLIVVNTAKNTTHQMFSGRVILPPLINTDKK